MKHQSASIDNKVRIKKQLIQHGYTYLVIDLPVCAMLSTVQSEES